MKYVLVTGAYGGMGKATVKALKNKGYFVFALDKRIGEKEENVLPIETDITDENSIKEAFNKVKEVTDDLYAMIHYAGIYKLDSLVEMEKEDFEKIFQINVFGAYLVNKTFIPLMKKGSKILITTSELAPLDPLPFTGIYGITKSALDKYAYSLRMELQLLGIDVSVLRAGAVNTGMLGTSTDELTDFTENTKLYKCNAARFRKIVDSVEAKNISPEKLAKKSVGIIEKKKTKFSYAINRNPLLLMLNVLPKSMQLFIIKQVLK